MAYVIAQPCIDELDESCIAVCPVDCIHFDKAIDRKAYIDPAECIDCGACEPECPVDAIFAADDLPAAWQAHAELNRQWFVDPSGARAALEEFKPFGG
jgi:NAD-dependent dihydropyrimidine dehydrogenase PreA subunit